MSTDLTKKTIVELRALLDAKDISVRELADGYLKNIKENNEDLNIFISLFKDIDIQIEVAQKMIDAGSQKPLTGIIYGIKDNLLYGGEIASAGSKILENHIATYDAHVVTLLKEQGAVCLGRMNMDDAAMGSSTETSAHGPTKNPVDTTRVPGGSSGGPAAGVAANMCTFSLGSSTGGSVRQPAGFCGVVGLKPTYANVSRSGLIAMSNSLDVIGPLTHTAEDSKIVLDVISQYDEMDATSVSREMRKAVSFKKPKKIGVPRHFLQGEGIDEGVRENFESTLKHLESKGYEIVDVTIPHIADCLAAYYVVMPAEVSTNLSRFDGIRYGFSKKGKDLLETYEGSRAEGFGVEVRRRITMGTHVLSSGFKDAYYTKAIRVRELVRREMKKAFEEVDAIVTPTSPTTAFAFGARKDPVAMYMEDLFTVPANMVGIPGIAIPTGLDADGLPFSFQILTAEHNENALFDIGADVETFTK